MASALSPREVRHVPPATKGDLWSSCYLYHGVRIATRCVCPEHRPPFEAFAAMVLAPPPMMLVLGPRGGGKSFLSALATHISSRHERRLGTKVLGGSLAQSAQTRGAIEEAVLDGRGPYGWNDADQIASLAATAVRYRNGSLVQMLPASPKAVRGPHVPRLRLDEIDEMDPAIRESAVGMAVERAVKGWDERGFYGETGATIATSITQTSTWHNPDGPMGALIEEAKAKDAERPGSFPFYSFCAFDVLERCPESISGPNLEFCPACPLVRWCHDVPDGGPPRAKRGNGHYTVRSLQQKAEGVSLRAFEADFLCRGPKVEGTYFPSFDPRPGGRHVFSHPDRSGRNPAEYDPAATTWLAIDPGPHTGAVFFQPFLIPGPTGAVNAVRAFADYYGEYKDVATVVRSLLDLAQRFCNGRLDEVAADPAGDAATGFGRTLLSEYGTAGLQIRRRWGKPAGSVADGIQLIEAFLNPAAGPVALFVHGRCERLISALASFRRARRKGQATYEDRPQDPQHPAEDLVEALRGGLRLAFPLGRLPVPGLQSVHPSTLYR